MPEIARSRHAHLVRKPTSAPRIVITQYRVGSFPVANDIAIRILRDAGNIRPEQTIEAALAEGIDLAVAATLLEKESSGGRNVWGHDGVRTGGIYVMGSEVTEPVYRRYRDALRNGRIGRQGIGPCQCTSAEFQDRADELGGCWDPTANMRSGFRGMQSRIVRAGGDVKAAAKSYNGRESYAVDFMQKLKVWRRRLAGVSVTRSDPHLIEWVEIELILPELREGDGIRSTPVPA
jgi:hypothetical protein